MLLIHSEGSDSLGLLEGILNLLLSGNETYQKMSSNFEREQNNRVRNYEYESNSAKSKSDSELLKQARNEEEDSIRRYAAAEELKKRRT